MRKTMITTCLLALCLLPLSTQSFACANHLYLNTQEMGFFGRTAARMMGLAPPQRVFSIEHTATAWATVGQETEIEIDYQRPFFARDVRIKLSGSENVQFPDEVLELDDRTGTIPLRFQVTSVGYNMINLTIEGQHDGELVREHSRIYVRSKTTESPSDIQVSAR